MTFFKKKKNLSSLITSLIQAGKGHCKESVVGVELYTFPTAVLMVFGICFTSCALLRRSNCGMLWIVTRVQLISLYLDAVPIFKLFCLLTGGLGNSIGVSSTLWSSLCFLWFLGQQRGCCGHPPMRDTECLFFCSYFKDQSGNQGDL